MNGAIIGAGTVGLKTSTGRLYWGPAFECVLAGSSQELRVKGEM